MADKKKTVALILAGAVLFAAAALLLYRLGAAPFQDYDEATYAEVSSESLAHGNYLSLTFLNNPFFRKPPLLFWLTDASSSVIPDPEYAQRLPGALSALALIVVVMLVGFEASGSYAAAILGGAILTATSAFIEPARQLRFDVLVTLFIVATLYAVICAVRNPRWYIVAGALLGLAILAKGVIAGFAVVAAGSYLLLAGTGSFRQRLSFLRNGYFWGGVAALLIIAVPWHAYETLKFGTAFWQSYVGNEVLARVQTNLFVGTEAPTNADYLSYLIAFGAPWTEAFFALLLALPFLYRRIDARARPAFIASVLTIVSILSVMFISQTKAASYLIPLYPFIAIVLALGIHSLYLRSDPKIRLDVICATVGCAVFGFALAACNGFHINPYFATQDELAREEKIVGMIIRSTTAVPAVYEYQDDDIGSIQYYAALPFTNHPYMLLLSDASVVMPGSLVVTTVSSSTLAREFPKLHFTPEYQGTDVSLFAAER